MVQSKLTFVPVRNNTLKNISSKKNIAFSAGVPLKSKFISAPIRNFVIFFPVEIFSGRHWFLSYYRIVWRTYLLNAIMIQFSTCSYAILFFVSKFSSQSIISIMAWSRLTECRHILYMSTEQCWVRSLLRGGRKTLLGSSSSTLCSH